MAEVDQKEWFVIAAKGDPDPERSLKYRGAVVLYPEEQMAASDRDRLVPESRRGEYEIIPANLIVTLGEDWRIVPAEMLATLEKGCQKT